MTGTRVIAAAALAVVACAPEETTTSPVTVTDSAGVRIVETVGTNEDRVAWSIDPDPIYRVGWDGVEPLLEAVSTGALRPDGSAVVADNGAGTLHFLTAHGAVTATVGREGEGPGEFGRIEQLVALPGDSLLVMDTGNLRVSFFDGPRLAGDTRFEGFFADAMYSPHGRSSDGRWVLLPASFVARALMQGELGWRDYPLLTTPDFVTVDTVAGVPLMYIIGREDWNPIRRSGFVASAGDMLVHGTSDAPRLRWMTLSGEVRQVARWDAEVRDVTDADWVAYEAGFRERNDPGSNPERYEQILRDRRRDFRGPMPLHRFIYPDSEGNVWMSVYDLAETWAPTFSIVSSAGEWVGSVRFPDRIRLLDIGSDRVLGLEFDEFDVQAVVAYRIIK